MNCRRSSTSSAGDERRGPPSLHSLRIRAVYPDQRRRCESVPGLTGLWQVSGKNRTTFEQMIAFDCEYGRRRSLWLDLKIIVLTPVALLVQVCDQILGRARPAPAAPREPAKLDSEPAFDAAEPAARASPAKPATGRISLSGLAPCAPAAH